MPPETFTGPELHTLLARARAALGPDAIVLSVGREGRELALTAVRPGDPHAFAPRAGVKRIGPPRAVTPGAGESRTADSPRLSHIARASLAARTLSPLALAARRDEFPPVIALVGPTGGGKTTTLAKLASHPDVLGGLVVGVLGLDTFRAGAVEELRSLGALARTPVEFAHRAEDVPRALKHLRRCDVVLVDTPGRGPRRREDHDTLRGLLHVLYPLETHAVIPAGLSRAAAAVALERVRDLGATHVLPTKLDEHPNDRIAFELAESLALPVRWYGDGQEIPSDLRAMGLEGAMRDARSPRGATAPSGDRSASAARLELVS
ncbi:MAG: hypothetical protein HOP12_04045 [Candidatus Eisenbacteria bacterium]|uniref:Flagella-associated GTP-binding protein n=1 Tax=Eiseniibacteriota bacterium TaxID=2212470 RepID=A0A849SL67_UNCEI|nr:hypothetical protein [Candidatus Eisenbacteria bacterium]